MNAFKFACVGVFCIFLALVGLMSAFVIAFEIDSVKAGNAPLGIFIFFGVIGFLALWALILSLRYLRNKKKVQN